MAVALVFIHASCVELNLHPRVLYKPVAGELSPNPNRFASAKPIPLIRPAHQLRFVPPMERYRPDSGQLYCTGFRPHWRPSHGCNEICRPTPVRPVVVPGHRRHRRRRGTRTDGPHDRRRDETARRRVRQADPHDDRAHHLWHGGRRHRQDGRHEAGGAHRIAGADLLRSGLHGRPRHRHDFRERHAPRRWRQRGRRPARPGRGRGLYDQRLTPDDGRLPDEHHPDHDRQRVRDGRHPPGAVLFNPVRGGRAPHGDARKAAGRPDRSVHARAVWNGRPDHVRLADRRLRRDRLHDRTVRHSRARVTRRADGRDGGRLPLLHIRRAGRHCVVVGHQPHQVFEVHQGRTADRRRAPHRRRPCCRA